MRDVIFRDLTSKSSRKKDIFLKEVFEKDGVMTTTERRSFYYIKNVTRSAKDEDLQKWVDCQDGTDMACKRHLHILKEHSDNNCGDKLLCKIAGTFYVLLNHDVYTVAFLHYFKVRFMKASLTK